MLVLSAITQPLGDMTTDGGDSAKTTELEIHCVRIVMKKARQLLLQRFITSFQSTKTPPSVLK
jgi:hypothetical protein